VAPLRPGVWGILATPFQDEDLSLDLGSLGRLVSFYRSIDATGVIALGVLGEAARLTEVERSQVLRVTVQAAQGMPVVAGVAAVATAPAIEEAKRAAAAGAMAVMVQVPMPDPGEVSDHIRQIAEASGLGVVVQDHPVSTGVSISPLALAQAVNDAGVAVAVKSEAPPTAPTIATLRTEIPDIPVFGGLGGVWLLDELLAGSAGSMTGLAVPEALVATVRAWESSGYEAARRVYATWMPLIVCEAHDKIGLAIRKEILRRRGLISGARVRPPGRSLPPSMLPVLDAHIRAISLPETGIGGQVA
jgi:4-hydroxy-tetrahydrodipicolinate synthase